MRDFYFPDLFRDGPNGVLDREKTLQMIKHGSDEGVASMREVAQENINRAILARRVVESSYDDSNFVLSECKREMDLRALRILRPAPGAVE